MMQKLSCILPVVIETQEDTANVSGSRFDFETAQYTILSLKWLKTLWLNYTGEKMFSEENGHTFRDSVLQKSDYASDI